MKRYFYIIVVLAIAATAAGIGSQVYLRHNLSDVTMTEETQAGDIKNAEGITFTQMFYDSDMGDDYYRWDITTDAVDPENSITEFQQTKDNRDFDASDSSDSNPISIQPLTSFDSSVIVDDGLECDEMLQEVLGDFALENEPVSKIVKAVADQVANGESKKVDITLEDYTDVMPLIITFYNYYETTYEAAEDESVVSAPDLMLQSIQEQLPKFPLTGGEKVEIFVKKNEEGLITEMDINNSEEEDEVYYETDETDDADTTESPDDSNADDSVSDDDIAGIEYDAVYDNMSLLTDKGLFFTFAGDSAYKTSAVYYVPLTKDEDNSEEYGTSYIVCPDDPCRKLVTLDQGETVESLKWDDAADRLLLVTSNGGENTFASYDPDDLANVSTVRLFGADTETEDGSDDVGTVVYSGDNLWVCVNGTYGLTALRYNDETDKYEVVMDLDCSQAFNQKYLKYSEYDNRTKVAYKDGRLVILYSLDTYDDYEVDEDGVDHEMIAPGETGLCVLTEDGIGYFGIYHCSLFDDDASDYSVSDNVLKEYQLTWKK